MDLGYPHLKSFERNYAKLTASVLQVSGETNSFISHLRDGPILRKGPTLKITVNIAKESQ